MLLNTEKKNGAMISCSFGDVINQWHIAAHFEIILDQVSK